MSILESIVLGLVQGLTEFWPISSSAQLRIVPALFGWPDPGAGFTAVTQLGSVAAVLIFFRSELWTIARAWVTELRIDPRRASIEAKLGWYILLGTVPISLFGLVFSSQIETAARSLYVLGVATIAFSFVMLAAERFGSRDRVLGEIGVRDGVAIGLAQVLALIPGVSRAGVTISAGLFRGFDRVAAARYSFLLAVPAIVLSGLYELRKVGEDGGTPLSVGIATLIAFLASYFAIAWLLRYLDSHTMGVFVAYRIALGALVLVLTGTGAIH